ncbi:GDP-L-fucose synthase [Bosea sp. 117]|uniref:GDP-L-fucose synthase family protein n=1 Tax=Bosea sp. 117 TaxID=1125973 RepID=UPI0004942B45|nr:GDP-L-fucose synthase [Bosea sp. 117]
MTASSDDGAAFPLDGRRIWVAGHTGMVGSAVCRRLALSRCLLLTATHAELDLRRQLDVEQWMAHHRPDAIVVAAATVGGILANASHPARFLYDNLMIAANVIHTADEIGVQRLVFLGSSCVYPRLAPQPMREDYLLTGPLEETNAAYAVAKIAGLKYAEAISAEKGRHFFTVMPPNLYGPGDNYDPQSSHVIPALMRKIHVARLSGAPRVEIWGTGAPLREFMHVDDLADAVVFLLQHYRATELINVGTGREISIRDLARLLAEVIGYDGAFAFDSSKPDGTPRKLLDCSRFAPLGWRPSIGLREGLTATYRDWCLRSDAGVGVGVL